MSGIYLKYPINNLIAIESNTKVSLTTIIRVTKEILPHSAPLNYRSIEGGFYLSFVNDKDINLFFTPQNLYKLKKLNLTPTLSPHSKINREVYIPGITRDIYYLPKDKIISEIKKNHNIDILNINLFLSRSDTRYLVITTGSKAARDSSIKNTVKLFGNEFKPQPKLDNRSHQQPSLSTYNRGTARPSGYTTPYERRRENRTHSNYNSWEGGPPRSTSTFYRIESARNLNLALPKASEWAGPQRTATPPTTNKTGLTVLKPRPRANLPANNGLTSQKMPQIQQIPPKEQAPAKSSNITNVQPPPSRELSAAPATNLQPTTIPASITSQQPTPIAAPRATTAKTKHQFKQQPASLADQQQTPKQQKLHTTIDNREDKNVINILSTVSEALSNGIEHPEIYLDIFAICLTKHGYNSITIPKYALEMSRNVYYFKNPDKTRKHIPFSVLHTTVSPLTPTFQIPVLTST